MHRFRSIHSIRRLRLAVFVLLFFRYALIPAFFLFLVGAILFENPQKAKIALYLLPVIGVFALFVHLLSNRTNCPLCATPVLGSRRCNKNPKARRLLLSYKLRVAFSILFTNQFRCPYCNEPSVLETRKNKRSEKRR